MVRKASRRASDDELNSRRHASLRPSEGSKGPAQQQRLARWILQILDQRWGGSCAEADPIASFVSWSSAVRRMAFVDGYKIVKSLLSLQGPEIVHLW